MSSVRRTSTAVGVALLGFATLVLLLPPVEHLVPTAAAVAALGNDYLFVAALAVLVLATMLAVVLLRMATGVTETTPPAVEEVAPRTPGRAVDASLESLPLIRVTSEHRQIHDRLRTAVIGTVARSSQYSHVEARERVDDGEWTEDADAAAFLAGDDFRPPSVAHRVRETVRREHWFRRRVRAVVAALETVSEDQP